MNTYEEIFKVYGFLEDFGYDVAGLEELVRHEPISVVWELFGSFQVIQLSARPGEHGVFVAEPQAPPSDKRMTDRIRSAIAAA